MVAAVSAAVVEVDSTGAVAMAEADFMAGARIAEAEAIVAAAASVGGATMEEAPTEAVRSEAPAALHLGAGPRADSDAALARVAATAHAADLGLAMGSRMATGIHLGALGVPRVPGPRVDFIMPR
jgi:hypothetical protein